MAKVVCLMSPNHGEHMYATLEMIRELAARGEQVVYFFRESYRQIIEGVGAEFRAIGSEESVFEGVAEDINCTFGVEVLFNHARNTLVENKKVYQKMLDRVMAEHPDYILHDSYTLWSKQIAKQLKIPAICTVSSFAYCDGMIEAAPELLLKYVLRMSESSLPKGQTNGLRMIITALVKNLQRLYDIDDLMDVFLAKEKLNLVFTSRDFQIRADLFDDSFKFIGPSFYSPEVADDFPAEFITQEPLVYIYLRPEFLDRLSFYRSCVAAFTNSKYRVMLWLGRQVAGNELGELPENIRVAKQKPPREFLKKAALMITNEGFDVVSEALYHETPLIMIPYAADQSLLANRVEELGAGIFLRQTPIGDSDLREAAAGILGDEKFRRNCHRISESFKAAGGSAKAVAEIFKLKQENRIFN